MTKPETQLTLQKAEIKARIDELKACLTNVPMPTLSYEQVESRIAYLKKELKELSNDRTRP